MSGSDGVLETLGRREIGSSAAVPATGAQTTVSANTVPKTSASVQHLPIARACGFTQAQLDGLDKWQQPGLFPDKERALFAYIDQVVGKNGEVDDAVFAELSRHFTPRDIVELTITSTQYVTTGLLTRSLRIKPETDGRNAMIARC